VLHQADAGSEVSNLCHQMIFLENTYGMFLLPLMDGTRSRQSIREEAMDIIRSGNIVLNGKPASEKSDEELLAEIDKEMANCAKYGLLVA
jgi:methyltransferase-like protein